MSIFSTISPQPDLEIQGINSIIYFILFLICFYLYTENTTIIIDQNLPVTNFIELHDGSSQSYSQSLVDSTVNEHSQTSPNQIQNIKSSSGK